MSEKMPQVRSFMTPTPYTVAVDTPVFHIRELMRERRVRHLPVKSGDEIVGIVSDRSVKSATDRDHLRAVDVMIPQPFWVSPETPLEEVAAAMAEEKYGCALVKESSGELVGIFTTADACRALRQVLQTFYPR